MKKQKTNENMKDRQRNEKVRKYEKLNKWFTQDKCSMFSFF